VVFGRLLEPVTWALIHALTRRAPGSALRFLMSPLTTRPVAEVLAGLTIPQRAALLALFGRMRSGAGFGNDLRIMAAPGRSAAQVRQPTLVIATRSDGSVPYVHAEALAAAIPGARLVESGAPSHMIWLGDDYPAIAATITGFLTG
jgi:pimeloyl-ACP methyl ester carboxylesterase